MNIQKFHSFMHSIDDDLLEEAKKPHSKKKTYYGWFAAVAACFLFIIILPFSGKNQLITSSELTALGYDMELPSNADQIQYHLLKGSQAETAQADFVMEGEQYTYEIEKREEPLIISDSESARDNMINWKAKGLDLCMVQRRDNTSLNWYYKDQGTQHKLSTSADKDELLETARMVILLTGLDLAHAPEGAEDIHYTVFPREDLTVAETTFLYEGIRYSYRMAATIEIKNDFTDISGMEQEFSTVTSGNVAYCRAKISLNPGQEGKIIWFDVVPGILYSVSMEEGATEENLLHMANTVFKPLQENR